MSKFHLDFQKNQKLFYYARNAFWLLLPNSWYNKKYKKIIASMSATPDVLKRVDYYNKKTTVFELDSSDISINEFRKKTKKKVYYLDLIEYLRFYKDYFLFKYEFGDVTWVPDSPSFLKSRPIDGDNQNAVLINLDKVRHFNFIDDTSKFEEKINKLVWRGKCYPSQTHRQFFMQNFHNKRYCNVGQTNTKNEEDVICKKASMTFAEQLKYKFVLAIEGNDVATNLKWIMSSNSIAMMVKPTYETWFMEGTLIPDFHYVLLKDDYSDLEEKINYYSQNINESLTIIQNANNFVDKFKNQKKEDLISLLVLKKYFEKSNQL